MTEVAGLAMSALGLTPFVSQCFAGFDNLRDSRRFGENYQRYDLTLDVLRLRFSRWNDSVEATYRQSPNHGAPLVETRTVRRVLGEINNLLEQTAQISERYGTRRLEGFDEEAALDISTMEVSKRLQELSHKRQVGSSWRQRVTWVFYDQREFRQLVQQAAEYISQLEGLLPTDLYLKRLLRQQVQGMKDARGLGAVGDAAVEADPLLHSFLSALPAEEHHTYRRNEPSGESRNLWGDEVNLPATAQSARGIRNLYEGNKPAGQSRNIWGTKVGGKSILED